MIRKLAFILQGTVNSTFNIYRNEGKNLYPLSFSMAILFGFGAIIFSFIICLCAFNFFEEGTEFQVDFVFSSGMNTRFYWRLIQMTNAILIVSYSLLAVYIDKCMTVGFPLKPTLKNLFLSLTKKEINNFSLIFFSVILFEFLMYRNLFGVYGDDAWVMLDGSSFDNGRQFVMTQWINEIVNLLRNAVPYCAALLFVFLSVNNSSGFVKWRRMTPVFIAGLISCFSIDLFNSEVTSFIRTYVISLLTSFLPFRDMLIPGIVVMFIIFLLAAFFYLASAAVLYFPFVQSQEQQEVEPVSKKEPGGIDGISG